MQVCDIDCLPCGAPYRSRRGASMAVQPRLLAPSFSRSDRSDVCPSGYSTQAMSSHAAKWVIKSSPDKFRTRSEEHTSELQSLMRISYAVFCLKKKNTILLRHYTLLL